MMKHILTLPLLLLFLSGPLAAQEELVKIEGGVFMPLYTLTNEPVRVEPFLLDAYPVTNSQFLEFVREHPQWSRSAIKPIFAQSGYLQHWISDHEFPEEIADSPVVNVSWFAARAYAKSRGKRLPTLHEWEFVGRASETDPNAAADRRFVERILGWYSQPPREPLPPVGQGFQNVYGAWDMHGLVWEWVEDFSSALVSGESRKGGETDRDLFCAAGVQGSSDPGDYAAFMRYALRSSLKANFTLKTLGFRCARSLEQTEKLSFQPQSLASSVKIDLLHPFRTYSLDLGRPETVLETVLERVLERVVSLWQQLVAPFYELSSPRKEDLVYDTLSET